MMGHDNDKHVDVSATIDQKSHSDSESDQCDSGKNNLMNPLLLHPVLVKIFNGLNVQDLLHSRTVCTSWLGSANLILSKRFPGITIVLKSSKDMNYTAQRLQNNKTLTVHSFCLHNFSPSTDFLISYGVNITKLELKFESQQQVRLSEIFIRIPNLKCLEIISLTSNVAEQNIFNEYENEMYNDFRLYFLRTLTLNYKSRSTSYSNQFLETLFGMSPNLKELKLFRQFEYGDQREELKVVKRLAQKQVCLESLELSLVFNELLVSLKNVSSLNLKSFICKQLDQILSEDLQTFLETTRNSLVYLEIGLYRCSSLRIQFPIMPNLEYLSLYFHHFYESAIPSFGSLMYEFMFPNLETLKISVADTNSVGKYAYIPHEIFPDCVTPCNTLKYLQLPENLKEPETIRRAVRLFPNINKLNLAHQNNPEVLIEVWKCRWSQKVNVLNISLPPDFGNFLMTKAEEGNSAETFGSFTNLKCLVISCGPVLEKSGEKIYGKLNHSALTYSLGKMKYLRRFIIELSAMGISECSPELLESASGLKLLSPLNQFGKSISGYALEYSIYDWKILKNSSILDLNFDLL